MHTPTLYIFAGLPASGKSTLAKKLAVHSHAAYIRIDTVEQGLRDLCDYDVCGEGYGLSHRVIADNLKIGVSVVADSCNTLELTRNEWHAVASSSHAKFVDIKVICSNPVEHRKRIETRHNEIENLPQLSWQNVLDREYHEWTCERMIIDTADLTVNDAFHELLEKLKDGNKSIL